MATTKITKKMVETFVREKLSTDDSWAIRGLEVIFSNQTSDEQAAGVTVHENGIGFSGCDAEIMTSFAEQVASWKAQDVKKFKSPLSPKQLVLLKKKIKKYAKQIISVSDMGKLLKMVEKANGIAS